MSVSAEQPKLIHGSLRAEDISASEFKTDGKTTYLYRFGPDKYIKFGPLRNFAYVASLQQPLMPSGGILAVSMASALLDLTNRTDGTVADPLQTENQTRSAKLVGMETIDGVETEHLNLTYKNLVTGVSTSIDLYLQTGEKPWLKQIVAQGPAGAGETCTVTSRFSNWQENPTIPEG